MRRVISLSAAIVFAVVVLAACSSKDKSTAASASGCGRGGGVAAPTLIVPSDGIPRISLDSLRAALDKGTAIVVDTRPAESYKQSHIKGSINIPVDQVANRINELPCDKFIVTYCS